MIIVKKGLIEVQSEEDIAQIFVIRNNYRSDIHLGDYDTDFIDVESFTTEFIDDLSEEGIIGLGKTPEELEHYLDEVKNLDEINFYVEA